MTEDCKRYQIRIPRVCSRNAGASDELEMQNEELRRYKRNLRIRATGILTCMILLPLVISLLIEWD